MTGAHPGDLARQADQTAAQGDYARAQQLFEQAATAAATDLSLWMKAAAMARAAGKPRNALSSVYKALEVAPLDFAALLMRASLLTALDEPDAGEAWGQALAQKPQGELPPQLLTVIADGERRHAAWVSEREQRLRAAMASAEESANEEERARISRFRSNALRRTRTYHSNPTHFHFPGLVEHEFWPRSSFPWLPDLEAATDVIAAELQAVLASERRELVPYIQYAAHEPLDQWRSLNHNPDWTAVHLWKNGAVVEANARHCPATLRLLERFRQPQVPGASPNAMFSMLAPRTAIPAHVGYNNARLVCHLPLIVPAGCWFRVGAETREWQRGQAFVFDDTIEHEAMNPTDELRVVFIFDVWHPGLSPAERQAVAALIASEGGAGSGL